MNHPRDDHDLPARQEEAVRRLLAESAGDEPMPAEVRARMDGLLTELGAERAAGAREVGAADAVTDADPPVTTLRSRRRRRLARGLLAAAAAVVVVGIGLQWADRPVDEVMGAITDSDPDRGDAAGSAAEESSRDTAVERAPEGLSDSSAPEAPDEPGADADAGTSSDRAERSALSEVEVRVVRGPLPVVRAGHLRADLVRVQRRSLPAAATADYDRTVLTAPRGFTCTEVHPGPGILVAVRYQRSPAVVAFREPVGSTQIADLIQCGTGDVLRSATIPAQG